jgi:hypothetical protein
MRSDDLELRVRAAANFLSPSGCWRLFFFSFFFFFFFFFLSDFLFVTGA